VQTCIQQRPYFDLNLLFASKIYCTKLLKEFPSESWKEWSLVEVAKNLKTPVQLQASNVWQTMTYVYCGEWDLVDLMFSREGASETGQSVL